MFLNDYLLIEDMDKVISEIEYKSKQAVDKEKVLAFIQEQNNTIFYLDKNIGIVKNKNEAIYAWIDCGYRIPESGIPIFISLIKEKKEKIFKGYFVGTAPYFRDRYKRGKKRTVINRIEINLQKFNNYYTKIISTREIPFLIGPKKIVAMPTSMNTNNSGFVIRNIQKESGEIQMTIKQESTVEQIANEIFHRSIIKIWNTPEGVQQYLKVIASRIKTLIKEKKEEFYQSNHKDMVIINSGILDPFGQDYYLCYQKEDSVFNVVGIVKDKSFYCQYAFEQPKDLKMIQFFDEDNKEFKPNEIPVQCSYMNRVHIIEERIQRFPEKWQTKSALDLAESLHKAIDFGIKMQEKNPFFAKAYYSAKKQSISWVLPYHLDRDINEEPELVIVIARCKYAYEVKTVLKFDEHVKERMKITSLYQNVW